MDALEFSFASIWVHSHIIKNFCNKSLKLVIYHNNNGRGYYGIIYFNLCFKQVMIDQSNFPFSAKYFILSKAQMQSSRISLHA